MTGRTARFVAGAGCLALALLAAGCGPRYGDVSGTVKYQGHPVAGNFAGVVLVARRQRRR